MREYLISAARHIAGAAIGGITAFLASQGLESSVDPETLEGVRVGIEAAIVAVGLATYALAEKGLKPLVRRVFGSEGVV